MGLVGAGAPEVCEIQTNHSGRDLIPSEYPWGWHGPVREKVSRKTGFRSGSIPVTALLGGVGGGGGAMV